MSERRGIKTSTLAGILVVAGIGIGALLNSIMPDLSFGLGAGWNGLGNPVAKSPAVTDPDAPTKATDQEPAEVTPVSTQSGPNSNAGGSETPPAVVYIVINGRDYLLRRDPDDKLSQKPATLQQVVQAVQEATGDENGVRARILLRPTAKTTTRLALIDALQKAKIPRGAIRTPEEPIEE